MNRKPIAAAAVVLALTIAACGSDHDGEYRAVCTNAYTQEVLPDSYCASPHANSGWYYIPYSTWHDHTTVNNHYYNTGTRITGGTRVAPKASTGQVKVQYAGQKKVTVYDPPRQAGTPVKLNQDAKKSTSVRSGPFPARKSFGSTTKTSSNRSGSFGGRR